jgi:hypothetical protein
MKIQLTQLRQIINESLDDSDERENIMSVYSDVYKEKHGIRPRTPWYEGMTTQEMRDELDLLHAQPTTYSHLDYDEDPLYDSPAPGICPKCGESVQLTSNGLITYHNVPGDRFNSCPGSQCNPVEKTE